MGDEKRDIIINDKGEEYYEEWIKLPAGQRDQIDLVVPYDIGWQKLTSGQSYSSRSSHAFVVEATSWPTGSNRSGGSL